MVNISGIGFSMASINWHKEAIDQPLHALWAGVSTWLVIYGLSVSHLPFHSAIIILAGSLSWAILIGREVDQKKHKPGGILYNWPWLDSIGYGFGTIIGLAIAINML